MTTDRLKLGRYNAQVIDEVRMKLTDHQRIEKELLDDLATYGKVDELKLVINLGRLGILTSEALSELQRIEK